VRLLAVAVAAFGSRCPPAEPSIAAAWCGDKLPGDEVIIEKQPRSVTTTLWRHRLFRGPKPGTAIASGANGVGRLRQNRRNHETDDRGNAQAQQRIKERRMNSPAKMMQWR